MCVVLHINAAHAHTHTKDTHTICTRLRQFTTPSREIDGMTHSTDTDIDMRAQETRHRQALSDRLVNEYYDAIYGHSAEALVYFEMARKFLHNPDAKLSEVWGQLFEEFACDDNKIAHDYELLEFIAAQCRRYGAGQ